MDSSHICSSMGAEFHDNSFKDVYTCGGCRKTFPNICTLHGHITEHNDEGNYHFDNIFKVAFPKQDSTCSSTQTDDSITYFQHHLDFVKKFKDVSKDKSVVNGNIQVDTDKIVGQTYNPIQDGFIEFGTVTEKRRNHSTISSTKAKLVKNAKRSVSNEVNDESKRVEVLKKLDSSGVINEAPTRNFGDSASLDETFKVNESSVKSSGNRRNKQEKTEHNIEMLSENGKEHSHEKTSTCENEMKNIQEDCDKRNRKITSKTWVPDCLLKSIETPRQCNPDSVVGMGSEKDIKSEIYDNDSGDIKSKQLEGFLFVCDVCDKSFKLKSHLKYHKKVHQDPNPYMCQCCGELFKNNATLKRHQNIVHSDRSTWLACKICIDKQFPSRTKLREHEECHRTEYNFVCEQCKKTYKSARLLKDHSRYAHSDKNFRCHLCKQCFDSEPMLNEHKEHKHKAVYKCKHCDKVFSSSQSKTRHEKIHLDIKPHECHICYRRFLQKTPYWIHMEKHHDLTKDILTQLFPEKHKDKNKQYLLIK